MWGFFAYYIYVVKIFVTFFEKDLQNQNKRATFALQKTTNNN